MGVRGRDNGELVPGEWLVPGVVVYIVVGAWCKTLVRTKKV